MNGFDRALDRMARGRGSDEGDQADLRHHRQIAQHPDRRHTEQSCKLIAPRRADEGAAREAGEREQPDGAAATDPSPLPAQFQQMSLEMHPHAPSLSPPYMPHL